MLEFLPSVGSVLSFGTASSVSKRAITALGRHRAIVYAYAALVFLLLAGALFGGVAFSFPPEMLPAYVLQVAIGALGAIAAYKALDYGKASVVAPMAKTYVLLVLVAGMFVLGEELSELQAAGSVLMVGSALVLAFEKEAELKPERWMAYLALSIACRAYYYTFIRDFVSALGPYQATVVLELGIAAAVVAFHVLRGRDISPRPVGKSFPAAANGALIFFGTVLYSFSVGAIGAALTAAISAGSPIVNAAASRILLGERLDAHKYAATLLLALGLALVLIG